MIKHNFLDEGSIRGTTSANGILNGSILNTSKFGILSFHYGNFRIQEKDPYGLLESLNKEKSISFVIHRINEVENYLDVIYKGNITAHKLWLMNMAEISKKSISSLGKLHLNSRWN